MRWFHWLVVLVVMASGIGSHTRPYKGPNPRPWSTAVEHIALPNDGLLADWFGRVWCNPPYGPETGRWLERMSKHMCGTALIFARTETDVWHRWVWSTASAILFLRGRLHFYYPDGTREASNAGGPSALVAYGKEDAERLRGAGIEGRFVKLEGGTP